MEHDHKELADYLWYFYKTWENNDEPLTKHEFAVFLEGMSSLLHEPSLENQIERATNWKHEKRKD